MTEIIKNYKAFSNRFGRPNHVGDQIYDLYDSKKNINRKFNYFNFADVKKNPDINIVIGFRNRFLHLETTLKYLNRAISNTNLKINIFVIEQDDNPLYKEKAKELNLNYAFLDIKTTSENNQYSRALVFNAAVKQCIKPKWWLFHDVDLLVDYDFFIKLEKHMSECKTWIQPFSEKRIVFVREDQTYLLQHDKKLYNLTESLKNNHGNAGPGAPGGSTLVPHDLFLKVGGYDDELFFGYAPEDAFFWLKLECMFGHINPTRYCHVGHATYCEDIYQYHQYHEPSYYSNPLLEKMEEIKCDFFDMVYEEKLKLIKYKENLFKEQIIC